MFWSKKLFMDASLLSSGIVCSLHINVILTLAQSVCSKFVINLQQYIKAMGVFLFGIFFMKHSLF